jgi:hypothetical protein
LTFRVPRSYNRDVVRAVAVLVSALALLGAASPEARGAVDAFLARLGDVSVTDLTMEQTLTLYDPAGRQPQSSGQQRVWLKLPRRQRVEQIIEGRKQVRLTVGERVWIRGADGRTYEGPPATPRGDASHLLVPFRRTGADLLTEWRTLGVRDDLWHADRVAGRAVTVIGARAGDRISPQVWLDPARGVVRFVTREKLPNGEGIVDVAFSEHRPLVGGFELPHRQEAFVNGKLVVLVTVQAAAVNVGVDDVMFDPDALRSGR